MTRIDTWLALVALIVSILALGLSVYFWRRQFRPIVTAAVRTHAGGSEGITYDLVVMNSGTIPARNICLRVESQAELVAALEAGATPENKAAWLSCFDEATVIEFLHNGASTKCAFGATRRPASIGFWKPDARIRIKVTYQGWFGREFTERQVLRIHDTDSFTQSMWAPSQRDTSAT